MLSEARDGDSKSRSSGNVLNLVPVVYLLNFVEVEVPTAVDVYNTLARLLASTGTESARQVMDHHNCVIKWVCM